MHNEFKRSVNGLLARLQEEGISDALVDEVCVFMGNWFITHIQGEDFAIATHIKARNQA
jgi:hemerythrin